jgi:thioredoxin 1
MKTPAKILILLAVAVAIVAAVALKDRRTLELSNDGPDPASAGSSGNDATEVAKPVTSAKLPKLIDLGADKCIPCKAMAPILDALREEYAGKMEVEFIDVWKNPDAGKAYGVEVIPTQIFYDATKRELFRHVGFYGKEDILAKWTELGIDFGSANARTPIVRETPVAADTRPTDLTCFMCDEDVNPRTKTVVKGENEQRILCGTHCYFIYFSSLVGADPKSEESKVRVTDWSDGNLVAASSATFLYEMDVKGRPTIKAFADPAVAAREQRTSPGNLVGWDVLRSKELATRCAFCDRAVYPEDACAVKYGGTHGYGCCTHCSMGVAARLKQDIEVEAKDGLTGEIIRVKTVDGQIASIEPATAVAWFGQKQGPDGSWVSAGCFKQGFFVDEVNLARWLEARPAMTGRQITIAQALADKIRLSPEQIAKACKLGECQ